MGLFILVELNAIHVTKPSVSHVMSLTLLLMENASSPVRSLHTLSTEYAFLAINLASLALNNPSVKLVPLGTTLRISDVLLVVLTDTTNLLRVASVV